mgnify:CR=1 FL=1
MTFTGSHHVVPLLLLLIGHCQVDCEERLLIIQDLCWRRYHLFLSTSRGVWWRHQQMLLLVLLVLILCFVLKGTIRVAAVEET